MSNIEKYISNFIETQFPEIYRDEGPVFVEFVKQYYEWMESSNNTLFHTRRLLEYKDIDDTVDEFVVKFKEKYAKEIQLDTASQTRKLIKHSLDLYRSKGTERSIDLFFRLVFGRPADVYYPGEDVFRLSNGQWIKPRYIEVTPSEYNQQFVGKQIIGISSGATAFVERYIRRKIKRKYVDILYISAISGDLLTGELISLPNQSLKNIPTIIGSLTTLDILAGSSGFSIGDIVTVETDNGLQGKARVSAISNIIGAVNFEIVSPGWGFTNTSKALISEKVLTLENVFPDGSLFTNTPFSIFETIRQPLSNVVYRNANATLVLENGDQIFTYYSNGSLAGRGTVLSVTSNEDTNGEIFVAETIGNLGPVVEPSANLSGTVSISFGVSIATGISSVSSTSNVVTGDGTNFTTDILVGSIIKLLAYDSDNNLIGSEEKKVSAVTSTTEIILSSNSSFDSEKVVIQNMNSRTVIGTGTSFDTDFVYGDKIVIFSNSSNYFIYTVNSVTNSTFLTIQEKFTFTNVASDYANTISNNFFYTSGNTIEANIHVYTDKTVTGNIIGYSSNVTLNVKDISSAYSSNTFVFQLNTDGVEIANGRISTITNVSGSNATLLISSTNGTFQPNTSLSLRNRFSNGLSTGITSNIVSLGFNIGVINIVSDFVDSNNNFVCGDDNLSKATVKRISTGTLAGFLISNSFQFSETVQLFPDLITNYANINLNADFYGFPKNVSANVDTNYLDDILSNTAVEMGGITSLVSINPGKNYDIAPFVLIYDETVAQFVRRDYIFTIENSSSIFAVGEIVFQDNGAEGQVISANLSSVSVKRIQFENNFDTSLGLFGRSSGVSANIVFITENSNTNQIGVNAVVSANVQNANGSVRSLEMIDTGFGYLEDEIASFYSLDRTRIGTAKVNLGRSGFSEGFYRDKNGFLSDSKKIFDGEYYQEYSYEIRTGVTSDKYSEMLKKILHVAGTKAFFAVFLSSVGNMETNIRTDITEE